MVFIGVVWEECHQFKKNMAAHYGIIQRGATSYPHGFFWIFVGRISRR